MQFYAPYPLPTFEDLWITGQWACPLLHSIGRLSTTDSHLGTQISELLTLVLTDESGHVSPCHKTAVRGALSSFKAADSYTDTWGRLIIASIDTNQTPIGDPPMVRCVEWRCVLLKFQWKWPRRPFSECCGENKYSLPKIANTYKLYMVRNMQVRTEFGS